MTNSDKPVRIVIVGGGVAGMALATRLGESLGRTGRASVTLVDKSFAHVWKPILHCFAAGTARNPNDRISFLSQASRHHFEFWPGEIQALDRTAKRLTLAPITSPDGAQVLGERTLDYDAMILAIGSRANDFGTPGVAEHCLFIDNLVEARAFNDRFRAEQLRAFGNAQGLDIAIVGGGATGTQLAAELHKALDLVALYSFGRTPPPLNITLLEAGPRILPAFPESVSAAAVKELQAIGVTVRTGSQVSGADAEGLILKDGSRVRATLRVWAAGVKAPEVTTRMGDLTLSRTGQIEVAPNLQSRADASIFAVGDCACITDDPVAPTAQAARQQALHLIRHFPAWIEGKAIPPFRFRNRGAVVALGDYNGWGAFPGGAVFGGGWLRGLSARLGHIMLYRQHQFAVFGVARGLLAWFVDWLESFVRPSVRLD
ncbi:NAD(P)/FAD-dependent oxidoreductase [Ameyamaea chiangmaiensis]|uniref:NAD(P)/FAD-dependent oxidoreductase n=1 Tax=Ameyamaea chiangmaiensis TaxID=442969 RepID=A0A850P4R2_9PROT|nr:NAD(P)/FAD-dependent oxidoreductase [Ameyamaea chiangmaiensis]MBS4075520.1 NAD(P)/FAD-dependent oxidoreductase [Ameyamaea chiangmaiensis]NVN38948.1 NAD(P)/FAD-dependent oxidoreductase [Ameyamaea chiangmaiensis]